MYTYNDNAAVISARSASATVIYQVPAVDALDLPSLASLRSFMECRLCTGTRASSQALASRCFFELGQFPWPWPWALTAPPRLWLSAASVCTHIPSTVPRHVYIGEITEAAACDSASCTRKQHQCYNEGNTWCSYRYDMPQHKLPRVALG